MTAEVMRALGRIEGKIGMMEKRMGKLDQIEERISDIDRRSAKNATVAGTAASVGVAIIVSSFKKLSG